MCIRDRSEHLQDDLVSMDKFRMHMDKGVGDKCPEGLSSVIFLIVSKSLQRHSRRPTSAEVCFREYGVHYLLTLSTGAIYVGKQLDSYI